MTRKPVSIESKLADPTLAIDADIIDFSREMIAAYKRAIGLFQTKAKSASNPQKRGGYKSHQFRNEQNLDRMQSNLAFQLEWLKRHRPTIYDEVK